ncbi:NUDIX hydrolase [Parahaliea maris]|uniref:NUDIX hydrolase n=1 Tax=Parahaliea maris TaxID=2716870 RepID=A0A5C8ZWU0_9GAMM|nr:NUDIX hydrolase [Parahaliea maris]TXS92082.1 NUDIX hydrolase [Parahaliea maris]
MSQWLRPLAAALCCSLLASCQYGRPPPCPVPGPGDLAPSAGCLLLSADGMLVVENWKGKLSPPGGLTNQGESAQCAAHRETWEESGLDVIPGELLATFDTGFNLYRCAMAPGAGELAPHAMTEVRRAYWLPLSDFGAARWRYEGQGEQLQALIQSSEPAQVSR